MHASVFIGSIVDPALGARAIVNSSNPEVALGGGVSGAIRDACGGKLYQEEIREAFEDEFDEPLEPDDCLVTGPGQSTAFRWVLHVPSVNYQTPDPETGRPAGPTRVYRCTLAALREAEQLAQQHALGGRFVLGIPLLAAYHGGLGEVASSDAVMKALRSACERASAIYEVRVVVLTETASRLVQAAAQARGVPIRASAPA